MFDGVHLGHQAVIETAVHSARRCGGLAAVLTFWPHPSRLLRPDDPVRQLQTPAQKVRRLYALGVDAVITEPFTAAFAEHAAAEFVPMLIRAFPKLAAIYVGENWRFGKGREGDVAFLVQAARARGRSVFSAPRVRHDGEPISSTRIRKLIESGEIELVNTLLGYTYSSDGVVTPGKQLGRTIGVPTLNLPWEAELAPRHGVYAGYVSDERLRLPAVANFGLRPTVEQGTEPRLEVHALQPCGWGTGDRLRFEWMSFLRAEQRFGSLDELKHQIGLDLARARAVFEESELK